MLIVSRIAVASATGGQFVGGNLVRLIAAALASVVGEDKAEVLHERLGEGRGLRVLERIREARIDKNR
jgi:hypothetical protein